MRWNNGSSEGRAERPGERLHATILGVAAEDREPQTQVGAKDGPSDLAPAAWEHRRFDPNVHEN